MVAAWMIEAKTIANGLRLASGCLADARTLVQSGSRNAAYLAEQCLEQIVRSLATSEGLHIERHDAHQLDKVVRRFPDDHPEKEALNGLVWLEAYATTFCYTSPSGQIPKTPSVERLNQALDALAQLQERVVAHFGVELNSDGSPAKSVPPMRKWNAGRT